MESPSILIAIPRTSIPLVPGQLHHREMSTSWWRRSQRRPMRTKVEWLKINWKEIITGSDLRTVVIVELGDSCSRKVPPEDSSAAKWEKASGPKKRGKLIHRAWWWMSIDTRNSRQEAGKGQPSPNPLPWPTGKVKMKIDGPKEIERPTLMDVIGIGTGIEFFFAPAPTCWKK